MDSCPNCGYCKHCGRGGHHSQPHYVQPQPFYPHQPQWTSPWLPNWGGSQTISGTLSSGGGNSLSVDITGIPLYKTQ